MISTLLATALLSATHIPASTLNGTWSGKISWDAKFSTCDISQCNYTRHPVLVFRDGNFLIGEDEQQMQPLDQDLFLLQYTSESIQGNTKIYDTRTMITRPNAAEMVFIFSRCISTVQYQNGVFYGDLNNGCTCSYSGRLQKSP